MSPDKNQSEYEEEHFLSKKRKEARDDKKRIAAKDRSKYKKTDREKRKDLLKKESDTRLAKKTLIRGRVLAITPPEDILVDCDGQIYKCVLRGVLKKEKKRIKNLLAVGDFVLIEPIDGQYGTIDHVEERRTFLSREDHLLRRKEQLLAANIDLVLITVSVTAPTLKPSLVDRYIIATQKGGMEPVIVVNKIDLLQEGSLEKEFFEEFVKIYRSLDIPVVAISAVTGEGLDELKKQMQGRASVFSGQSGVGKSSLINMMTGLSLPIGALAKTMKGSHTTSRAHLIPLSFGGWCIDTPGIRSFGIWDLKREDLERYFPEIAQEGRKCKYPNCTHSHEPDCAVHQALNAGKIHPLRFESYQKLLQELKEK